MKSTSIEQRIEGEIWEMLKELRNNLFLASDSKYVLYDISQRDQNSNYPSTENQRKILDKFEYLHVLKIVRKNYLSENDHFGFDNKFFELKGLKPRGVRVSIDIDKFDLIFQEYALKYSHDENERPVDLYITKDNDVFYYNNAMIKGSYKNDAFRVFSILYDLMTLGGRISYDDLGKGIKNAMAKTKKFPETKMQKFIQLNLTDNTNGFIKRAQIKNNGINAKSLLEIERGYGIIFNNRKS